MEGLRSGAGEEVSGAGLNKHEELSELWRGERAEVKQVAKEQGLKQSSGRWRIWLPRDQEERGPGSIPSKFFVQKYNKEDKIMFHEHTLDFPIQDLGQLTKSLEALGALYEAGPTYDIVRDNRDGFKEFVSGLVEPKQPNI